MVKFSGRLENEELNEIAETSGRSRQVRQIADFRAALANDLRVWLWRQASKFWNGGGAEDGVEMRWHAKRLDRLRDAGDFCKAGGLEIAITGAVWPMECRRRPGSAGATSA